MSDSNGRRRDHTSPLVVPMVLIAAGVLLLLGRFGGFDWGVVVGLLELWPLLLIALGADIITRGRYRLPIVLTVVALGAIFYYVPGWFPGSAGWLSGARTSEQLHDVAYEIGEASAADVELRHGVGVLNLDALPAGSALLVGGEVTTGRREQLVRSYEIDDGVARLRLAGESGGPSFGLRGTGREWNLAVSRDLPTDLNVATGVGETELRLRPLTLSTLALDAGVGRVDLTLPERGGYRGEIDAGVGELTIRIPRQVQARLQISSGLGRANLAGEWIRDGDVHATAGYADAASGDRVTLRVRGGVGRLEVVRID